MTTEDLYNRSLHRLAIATTVATFPLIFMGGLVTSHGAGMSVPDWPNTYGYNMFLFPPRLWRGGIFYEHVHRLMGTVVGLLSILLTYWAWRSEDRRWVRWLCTGVLAAVILQGVLGGLRVLMVELDLAIVHACFAQAFFCLSAMTAVVTSRWWLNAPDLSRSADAGAGRRLTIACTVAVVALFAQLVVGATMRHYEAGLAVPDLPLAYGQIIPATDAASLEGLNRTRVWKMRLPAVTRGQIWLHMGHRIGAIMVTAALTTAVALAVRRDRAAGRGRLLAAFVATVAALTFTGASHALGSKRSVLQGVAMLCLAIMFAVAARVLLKRARTDARLAGAAVVAAALLAAQVALGVLTVIYRKPADVASAHVAVGALTLAVTFVLAVRSARLFAKRSPVPPKRASEDVENPGRPAAAPGLVVA